MNEENVITVITTNEMNQEESIRITGIPRERDVIHTKERSKNM